MCIRVQDSFFTNTRIVKLMKYSIIRRIITKTIRVVKITNSSFFDPEILFYIEIIENLNDF